MLCERCDNFEATFHLTEISNNVQNELHLCSRCAKNINFNSDITGNLITLRSLSAIIADDAINNENNTMCLKCGLTDVELTLNGRPGCPSCYKYFKSILETISGNNNKKKYSGKKPFNYVEVMDSLGTTPILNSINTESLMSKQEMEEELKVAVIEERYEDAAKLRDKIKEVNSFE